LKLKFHTVAEKTAKNFRGLLYFAAPGTARDHVTASRHCIDAMLRVAAIAAVITAT